MAFENLTLGQLLQIAQRGGGFALDAAALTTGELSQIAAAAAVSGARIVFRGISNRPHPEILQIAAQGQGAISFED
jgi:hypothetical protein